MIAEIEYAVLAGTLAGHVEHEEVVRQLKTYEFEDPEAQIVFDEIVSVVKHNKKLNSLLVKNKCGTAVSDETWLYLDGSDTEDSDVILDYIAELKRKSFRDRQKKIYRSAIARIEDNEDPEDVYNSTQASLSGIDDSESTKKSKNMRELANRFLENLKKKVEAGEDISGLSTSFRDLDEQTSGMHPGDLIVVAGRPAMGKTTFAINIGEQAALKGKRVIIYSFEMPADQLTSRIVASLGSIDFGHIKNGKLTEMEAARLPATMRKIPQMDIEVDDSSGLDIYELRKRILKHQRDKKIDLIIIDYLQLMKMSGGNDNRSVQIGEITTSLKGLAKDLGIPIILLSQLNRSVEQRPNKRPVNADLRESGSIEQDADMIIFVYRDEVYNTNSEDVGVAEIIIGKQRSGPIGTVRLKFAGKYSRFENLAALAPANDGSASRIMEI